MIFFLANWPIGPHIRGFEFAIRYKSIYYPFFRLENLLQKRPKTQEEIEKEENEYKAFLKKLEQKKVNEERDKHEVELLTGFWERDDLEDGDKFLREYVKPYYMIFRRCWKIDLLFKISQTHLLWLFC